MIIHLSDRSVVRVHGEGARAFLNGILTNDLSNLSDEAPVWAGLLTPQGKYIADMIVFAGGTGGDGREEVLLDMHRDRVEAALAALRRYRLRRPLDIDPVELRVFAGWDDKLLVAPTDPRSAALGMRWLAATANVTGELADYHARRIALGIPDSPDFTPDKTMWLETNADLLGGVSFTKGCFIGQENTARMNYRGKVRKRIVPIGFVAGPAQDVVVRARGKTSGTLTSQAEMPDGRWRGLAHMRLEDAQGLLEVDGAEASAIWPDWLAPAIAMQDESVDAANASATVAQAAEKGSGGGQAQED